MSTMIKLLPNSQKLKNVIHLHGDEWTVLRGPEPMQCFNKELGLFVESVKTRNQRNVRVQDVKREWEQ